MNMKDSVILDAFGVIFKHHDDIAELMIPYLKENGRINEERFVKEYKNLASLGKITSQEFFNHFGMEDLSKKYVERKIEMREDFKQFLKSTAFHYLQSKYHFNVLSNDLEEWSQHIKNKFGLEKYFVNYFSSGNLGFRKPDKEVYLKVQNLLNESPEKIYYVDDKAENLIPARDLGWNVIEFNGQRSGLIENCVNSWKELSEILRKNGK